MIRGLESLLKLVSIGFLPWSFAIIYLVAGLLRFMRSKAKPELLLVGISFIAIIAVAVIARSSATHEAGAQVTTGPISQQGESNAAGVAGNVIQGLRPCEPHH